MVRIVPGRDVATNFPVSSAIAPNFVAAADGMVWMTSGADGGGAVARIDPAAERVADEIPLEPAAGALQDIAADATGAWVTALGPTAGEHVVYHVDPESGAVLDVLRPPGGRSPRLAGGPDGVWTAAVADPPDGQPRILVSRVDFATGGVAAAASFPVAAGVGDLSVATGEGALWIAVAESSATEARSAVYRIDPSAGDVAGPIAVPGEAVSVAAGEGGVWVLTGDGAIHQIDPGTNRVVGDPRPLRAPGLFRVVAGSGAVWVLAERHVVRLNVIHPGAESS